MKTVVMVSIIAILCLAAGCRHSTPTPEMSGAGIEKREERVMRTQVMREGDRVWLEGNWGAAYPGKESTVHWAQSAIMENLGEDVMYEYLLGVSALAFRMQVHKTGLCPSSPHSACGIDCVEDSLNALPWQGTVYGGADMDDAKKAEVRRAVAESIDRGVPVQFGTIEDGLIIGYQKGGAEWICVHSMRGAESYVDSQEEWPWGITVFGERKNAMPDRREAVVASLRKAVRMADAPEDADEYYYVGFRAWEIYINTLESLDSESPEVIRDTVQGNAHIYCCLVTYRAAAAAYLREVAGDFAAPASTHLMQAADLYERLALKVLRDEEHCVTTIAPYGHMLKPGQEWTSEMRREQVRRLNEALVLERQAIGAIEKALAEMDA